MEATEEVHGENSSELKAPSDKDSCKDTEKILSVDRVTLEKIVLQSSNGSREVLLTKNESLRKLSIKSGTGNGVLRRSKDERKESTSNVKYRVSLPEDVFTSKLSGSFGTSLFNGTHSEQPVTRVSEPCAFSKSVDQRIRPIKLTKSPSIGSILTPAIEYSISHENKNKVPPKVPEKPKKPSAANPAVFDFETEIRVVEDNLRDENHRSSSEGREEVNVPEVKIIEAEIKTEKRAQDRLAKSQCNIEDLQKNLGTKINPSTAKQYKENLPKLRANTSLTSPTNVDANFELAFDQDFLEKHNLDKRLKIEEKRLLETDLDYASGGEPVEEEFREEAENKVGEIPSYSRKVLEVEKRWSGEYLDRHLERNSSESSKSSYVEEFGSGSSRESVLEDPGSGLLFERKHSPEFQEVDPAGAHSSQEVLEDSTASTVDSDSCLEDRIKAADADIERQDDTDDTEEDGENESVDRWDQVTLKDKDTTAQKDLNSPRTQNIPRKIIGINNNVIEEDKVEEESLGSTFEPPEESTNSNRSSYVIRNRSRGDGYANLIKELNMEAAGSSRVKKEEKQKKKLGLRRLLPGFFSPKDSRKEYKKKEQKERKRHDERHFARYQQNGNYTRSPDTMNLNEDIKRNVKLDNSLNGSIIEEKLDEIKRELFPDQGPITSTPDHFSQSDDRHILCDRARVPRSYTNDSSLSSIAPDDKWIERNMQLGISPDIRKYEQRQKREEFDQSRRFAHLERKHSLQEPNHGNRPIFFQRNHGPSGRISAPPSERYLVRPRAIHPIDRPLPAIPRSRIEFSNYQNYPEEEEEVDEIDSYRKLVQSPDHSIYVNQQPTLYENTDERTDGPGLSLQSVSAQVKITRQPIVNQNRRAPLVGRSPKHASSGSSQKSGDYGDSSCTPNSSQKSEFSPSSSKSGEYYLHSPRGSSSPNDHGFEGASVDGIYENENHSSPNKSSAASTEEHLYDETPPSSHSNKSSPSSKQLERSADKSPSNRSPASKSLFQQPPEVESTEDVEKRGRISAANSPASPTSRSSMSSRKSQPNDQILIASPKRDISHESRICRPSNESRNCALESPVPMMNSPHRVPQDSYGNQDQSVSTSKSTEQISATNEIQRPEPIYGRRRQVLVPRNLACPAKKGHNIEPDDRVAWVQGQKSSPTKGIIIGSQENIQPPSLPAQKSSLNISQERVHVVPNYAKKNPIYEASYHQQRQVKEPIYLQRVPEPIYGHKSVVTTAPLSPSKRETRQHLEAFYWQQKALDAHRKSVVPPTPTANFRQLAPKIDLPEVREAVYWQQLKKLDEEQQRRIYNQNLAEESTRNKVEACNPGRGNAARQNSTCSPTLESSISAIYGDRSYWDNRLQRAKINPSGKPPLMLSQKGQNQPVLIVRPQQAIRERREIPVKPVVPRDPSRQETQRSKSASPHLHRGDAERLSAPGKAHAEEEGNRSDGKIAPPPIFKRGSLIGGETVEYGSTGPKRVSFSSQSNAGPDLSAGNWPTKHGPAPEPPTRRHRSEDSTSDTDSVFSHRDTNQDYVYGHPVPCSRNRETQQTSGYRGNDGSSFEIEYDANRPLPPPPPPPSKESVSLVCPPGNLDSGRGSGPNRTHWTPDAGPRRAVSPTSRNWPSTGNENRCGADRQEEEWNPDGKGRQSNDIGGSGRGEGEPGANELTGRRGGGGGGGGVGVGSGGSVLGVGSGGGGSIGGSSGGRSSSGGGGRSRDEPRRHTLGGDHQPSLHHQQFNAGQPLHPLHPHHLPPPHGQYGTPPARHTTMDLEMGTKSRQRKSPLPRGYAPPSSAMLFDDDPGIMSEVETSSTGFHRGGKQRSSLPVVRTPSKTLERPLGLVFLQYRNETKRALLPNEITSIDTVKALFVRSFPKQLTMEYLDSPHVKVYIHDSNKDMFYELEDLRSHLRDIRDRSVLRLFESTDGVTGMPGPLGIPGGGGLPPHWEDQSYFSEPEFDSEYQHQHIHKSKTAKNSTSGSSGYYVGGSSTLPRGGPLLRAYSPAASSVVGGPNATPTQPKNLTTPGGGGVPPAKPLRSYQCGKSPLGSLGGSARFSRDSSVSLYSIPDRLHGESGYMSSPERGGGVGAGTGRYPPGPYSAGSSYEDPYYSQYSGTVTPVIDEEASDTELLEESYSLYGVKPPGRPPSGPPRSPFPPGAAPPLPPGQSYDATRIRVEHMERQLANLTGLVQKALTHAPHTGSSPRDYLQVSAARDPYARAAGAGDEFDKHSSSSSASLPDDSYLRTDVKPPKLGKDKSVSFEKSVSFSDEPPDMNSPKQHSPQHAADTKPPKPAIKSSTLPRMSSQERDRHKPTPPPKPAALVAGQYVYRDLALTPEMYNQLRGLQKKAKDLRQEVRNLRRMSQAQAHTVRETIRDTFITIRAMLLSGGDAAWTAGDAEKVRLSREEDLYKQEMLRLEKDLTELESTVEELRGNVINKKTRVIVSDVENMALILSKSSKTLADLKVRFPSLQEGMKGLLSSEMEKVVREEKFLKEEPERLESTLRRCKKLTSTLVTLKRLASVQEQRLPNAASVDAEETPPVTPPSAQHSKAAAPVPAERTVVGSTSILGGGPHAHESSATHQQRPENALDALLDELQTFSRPNSQLGQVTSTGSHQGSTSTITDVGRTTGREPGVTSNRAPCISDIGRKGSVDSSSGAIAAAVAGLPSATNPGGTLRRLHSYPSSSDTDTSPPIARLQVSLQEQPNLPVLPQSFIPGQKPPVPERNAELLQLASARRVPPPPPPRTSSRSPLASPTSPQLPPRNHACNIQGNATLRRPATRGSIPPKEGKPPMTLPPDATTILPAMEPTTAPGTHNSSSSQSSAVLSTSNSSSCESVNSQEGLQSKRGRQEQLEQRHQELLRKQKALQEQYARLQQLQRNAAGLATVPPAPPDLLKKTGSESNLLAKMGLGMSAASSGSLTSLSVKPNVTPQEFSAEIQPPRQEDSDNQANAVDTTNHSTGTDVNNAQVSVANSISTNGTTSATTALAATSTTTSKIYETDIL